MAAKQSGSGLSNTPQNVCGDKTVAVLTIKHDTTAFHLGSNESRRMVQSAVYFESKSVLPELWASSLHVILLQIKVFHLTKYSWWSAFFPNPFYSKMLQKVRWRFSIQDLICFGLIFPVPFGPFTALYSQPLGDVLSNHRLLLLVEREAICCMWGSELYCVFSLCKFLM